MTGFDSADEGVRQAKAEASRLCLRITASVDMFEQLEFGENRWDLIVLTCEPVKQIASKVEKALPRAAGGTVCWEVVTFRCGADGWKFTREKSAEAAEDHPRSRRGASVAVR